MAQKVLVQLIDDMDGTASDDVGTVHFGLDGVTYEVDLSEANADKLRDVLAEYVNVARRTGGRVRRGSRVKTNGTDATAIREWAQANGIELATRGRIPGHVADSYREAQEAKKAAPPKRKRARRVN